MKRLLSAEKVRRITLKLLSHLTFLALSVLAFLLIAHYVSLNTEYEYTDIEKTSGTGEHITAADEPLYTLVLENDKLVIYSEDGSAEYVDTDTRLLTEYDRELLGKGISAGIDEINNIIGSLMS